MWVRFSVLGIQVFCICCEVRSAEARSYTSAFVCCPPLLTWAKETSCVPSHSSPFVDLECYFFTFRRNRLVVKKEVMLPMVRGNVQQDRYWIQQQLLKRWVCLIKETEASFKIVKPQINLITDWLEFDILCSFSVAGILSWCLCSCNWIIISSHVLWANELLALLQSSYIRQTAANMVLNRVKLKNIKDR